MDSQASDDGTWLRTLNQKARSSDKSWTTAFWLSLCLGFLGADRFYLGYGILGLLKLFTIGGGGLWWLLDVLLLLANSMKDAEGGTLDGRFRR